MARFFYFEMTEKAIFDVFPELYDDLMEIYELLYDELLRTDPDAERVAEALVAAINDDGGDAAAESKVEYIIQKLNYYFCLSENDPNLRVRERYSND
jgi:hypothetical protein